ncbi:hypothetical protein [Aurantiacibacter aquimixticola]|uniref:DUF2157 domain-containing protein n=1 Tax=Aurantiacibacter aquimixticola TaxID=1958945 RepID=A0A419RQT1_9SPHN|nr:hypothetical protein [Aurantiacibacter aquimixticola]RJY08153.1 hypothetical protein D6201_01180 [Aurantiacibacter aquimixticola]
MYSEQDLRDAVAGGAMTEDAASALRSHVAQMRKMPITDEENFRLVSSFNDIFVAIGVVIMLVAMGAVGQAIAGEVARGVYPDLIDAMNWRMDYSQEQWETYYAFSTLRSALTALFGGVLVAASAWGLAEFFTRRRRMALPSILLLLAFIGGVAATAFGVGWSIFPDMTDEVVALVLGAAGLAAAAGAWFHWKRFMVPITVAAGAASVAVTVIALLAAAIATVFEPQNTDMETIILTLVFAAGLGVFAFAMRWDTSDRERKTRRSDVAFWLHLVAAPMIAHPVFALIGVMDNDQLGVGAALAVLGVYIAFGLVALAIDRRALLVSALAYVLIALTFLFDRFGAVELTFALTALVIGSALLTLSAFWAPIRTALVDRLPGSLQERLPITGYLAAA